MPTETTQTTTETTETQAPAQQTTSYTIQEGDTLSQLAQQYGTTVSNLQALNPQVSDPNWIYTGNTLNIPGQNQLITTASQAQGEAAEAGSALQGALGQFGLNQPQQQQQQDISVETYSDPFTQQLDALAQSQSLATQNLIKQIQAKRSDRQNQMTQQKDLYERGLQLLGLQGSGAQATPDILQGQIFSIEQQHQKNLSDLDREESTAILEAETAQSENDLRTLKEKMDYVKEIKRERQDELKRMYENLTMTREIAGIQAEQIFDTMQTLNDNEKQAFLMQVAQKYGMPIGTLTAALAREKQAREDADFERAQARSKAAGGSGSGKKLSTSDVKNLMDLYPEVADQLYFQMPYEDAMNIIQGRSTGGSGSSQTLTLKGSQRRRLNRKGFGSGNVEKFNSLLSEGYSPEQIYEAAAKTAEASGTESPFTDKVRDLLNKYLQGNDGFSDDGLTD